MSEREYRQDDQATGYCPKCGRQLANLTVGLRGYCELHGWTFADWTTQVLAAEEIARETIDDYTDEDVTRILREQVRHD